ncbi:MAG: terminase small subunit [Gammaproteobacteria bacterium]|jgi:hypothetical protein
MAGKRRRPGRPSKYTPALQGKAELYLRDFEKLGDVVPTVGGLARYLGVRRRTLQLWARDPNKPRFFRTLGRLMELQELTLINGGLSGELNSTFVILMLHNHGYGEKTQRTVRVSHRIR